MTVEKVKKSVHFGADIFGIINKISTSTQTLARAFITPHI